MGDAPLGANDPGRRRPALSAARLLGLDRSGPPPPETLPGSPLNAWTLPNAIGFVRLALIPVFLVVAYRSADGRDAVAAAIYAVVAWSDYADGIAARLTGQYSRLGALLDPVVDRLLVVAGLAVCWSFDLLPRWAIALLAARELLMLALGRAWVRRGLELRINWLGRIGVWPTMSAIFFAMVGLLELGEICLYAGLAFSLAATILYVRSGVAELRARAHEPATPG